MSIEECRGRWKERNRYTRGTERRTRLEEEKLVGVEGMVEGRLKARGGNTEGGVEK